MEFSLTDIQICPRTTSTDSRDDSNTSWRFGNRFRIFRTCQKRGEPVTSAEVFHERLLRFKCQFASQYENNGS